MMCGEKSKSWLMILCCFLPIIALIALQLFSVEGPYVKWLAFLACPLAMLLMMRMNGDKEKCH